VFEDGGHGFRKNEKKEEAYEKIVQFLDTYLK
jgi:dipeptidyl aminopeptidase/acylaminoacyl peptidase